MLRRIVLQLHLYVALIAGVFVAILGITGSIMAFEQEIERLFHRSLYHVTPQAQAMSLADIGGIMTRQFPGEPIRVYGLSAHPDTAYQMVVGRRMVFVNQYTGAILGTLEGPDAISRFLGNVHQLHLRLLIRSRSDPGKSIQTWAGVAIIFLALSGIYLWWPRKRVGTRSWFDLHNTVGVVSFAFLLTLAITGVVIGFDQATSRFLFKITGTKEPRIPRNSAPHMPGATPIPPDQVVEIARATLPGAAPFAIEVPGSNGIYFIRSRYPEDLTPGGRSLIALDQYTGKVLFVQSSRAVPGAAHVMILNRAIHTGDIFGIPSKIVMSLASLSLVLQLVSGLVIWWKRRKLPRQFLADDRKVAHEVGDLRTGG